jgi:hypothetical protein
MASKQLIMQAPRLDMIQLGIHCDGLDVNSSKILLLGDVTSGIISLVQTLFESSNLPVNQPGKY